MKLLHVQPTTAVGFGLSLQFIVKFREPGKTRELNNKSSFVDEN